MRFVHVADAHLDTSFASRSEAVRARLRDASRDAFRRAVELAIREEVHAFLIAGDLFDGERLSFQTERFLLEQFDALHGHGVALVYCTGNHDPGAGGARLRRIPWPADAHVASDRTPRRIRVHDREGAPVGYVTGVGHAEPDERADLSRLLPRPDGDLPEVAVLHTQVHSSLDADAHHPYAPSELTYLMRAGYDYWALGHVHTRQLLSSDPPVAYSGSLQGRTHGESGPHGALLVDLTDRSAPSVDFCELAAVRWETIDVSGLGDAASLDRLERRVQAVWRGERADDPGRDGTEWMVRVRLRGPCPLWAQLRDEDERRTLAGELRDLLGALDVTVLANGVYPVVSVEEHRQRADALGTALQLLDEVRSGTATLEGIGPGDLAGVDSDDPEAVARYVREVLADADGELAASLLGLGTGSS